jgi:hypothetical protein
MFLRIYTCYSSRPTVQSVRGVYTCIDIRVCRNVDLYIVTRDLQFIEDLAAMSKTILLLISSHIGL